VSAPDALPPGYPTLAELMHALCALGCSLPTCEETTMWGERWRAASTTRPAVQLAGHEPKHEAYTALSGDDRLSMLIVLSNVVQALVQSEDERLEREQGDDVMGRVTSYCVTGRDRDSVRSTVDAMAAGEGPPALVERTLRIVNGQDEDEDEDDEDDEADG